MARKLTRVSTGDQSEEEKYDWISIRMMYVEGYVDETGRLIFPSAKDIADMMFEEGDLTALKTIQKKAVSKKWARLREEHKEALDEKRRELMIVQMAKKKVNFDMSCLNIAEAGLNEIIKHFKKHREDGELVPVKDLERHSRTLAKYQISGRLALGDTPKSIEDELNKNTIDYNNLNKVELEQLETLLDRSKSKKDTEGEEA